MSVMLSDREVRAAEKLIDSRTQELESDRMLAIAFGEIQDEEFEAMRTLRQALRGSGSTKARNATSTAASRNGQRRVAIGKYAYDYLSTHDSLENSVRDVIRAAKPRQTLVGLAVPNAETAKLISTTLRSGASTSKDRLERRRLESAAARVERLVQ